METARKNREAVAPGEEFFAGLSAFGLDRLRDVAQFGGHILSAVTLENLRCLGRASLLRQPTGALGNPQRHEQEKQRRQRQDAELPAPLQSAGSQQADQVIRDIGQEDAERDVELKERHQASPLFGRGDLGDIHGPDHGGAADGQSAEETEEQQRRPIPGRGAPEGGDQIKNSQSLQGAPSAKTVRWNPGEHRAENGSPQPARNGEAQGAGREPVGLG